MVSWQIRRRLGGGRATRPPCAGQLQAGRCGRCGRGCAEQLRGQATRLMCRPATGRPSLFCPFTCRKLYESALRLRLPELPAFAQGHLPFLMYVEDLQRSIYRI